MTFSSGFWLIISLIIFGVSALWLIVEPGFEPLIGFLGGFATFLQSRRDIDTREERIEGSVTNEADVRRALIRRIEAHYINTRLENSLVSDIRAELELAYTPELVRNISGVKINGELPPLKDDNDILNLFSEGKQATGLLLITGEPGAGKSTTLLRLQKMLLEKAKASEGAKIPVLFELSRWNGEPLQDWLTQELQTLYDISPELSQNWTIPTHPKIIPLLDGLDEVVPVERRLACVEAINAYKRIGVELLVCSRVKEYRSLMAIQQETEDDTQETLLALDAAIELQPLSAGQIKDYLKRIGDGTAPISSLIVSELIEADDDLLKIASSPLFLNMMILAYKNPASLDALSGKASENAKRDEVFKKYVESRYENKDTLLKGRKARRDRLKTLRFWKKWRYRYDAYWQLYTDDETQKYLRWLAGQMPENELFLIEELQPDLLQDARSQHQYRRQVSLFVRVVLGLTLGLSGGLMLGISTALALDFSTGLIVGIAVTLIFGLSAALFFGLAFGLIAGMNDNVESLETMTWNWQAAKKGIGKQVVIVILYGSAGGILLGLTGWILFALAGGMYIFASHVLAEGYIQGSLTIKNKPNQGMRATSQNARFNGLINGLSAGLTLGLAISLTIKLIFAMVSGLFFGLAAGLIVGFFQRGGVDVVKHIALRRILMSKGILPGTWNYASFLEYCCELRLLVRVGGGYKFIHRELQAYYAAQGDDGQPGTEVPV